MSRLCFLTMCSPPRSKPPVSKPSHKPDVFVLAVHFTRTTARPFMDCRITSAKAVKPISYSRYFFLFFIFVSFYFILLIANSLSHIYMNSLFFDFLKPALYFYSSWHQNKSRRLTFSRLVIVRSRNTTAERKKDV